MSQNKNTKLGRLTYGLMFIGACIVYILCNVYIIKPKREADRLKSAKMSSFMAKLPSEDKVEAARLKRKAYIENKLRNNS